MTPHAVDQTWADAAASTRRTLVTEGRKDDQEKPRLDLLPGDALVAVAEVLSHGAAKYGAGNWVKGMAWSRLWGALLRHGFAWFRGEDFDPETGKPHLAHITCCALFLLSYHLRGAGTDDRQGLT